MKRKAMALVASLLVSAALIGCSSFTFYDDEYGATPPEINMDGLKTFESVDISYEIEIEEEVNAVPEENVPLEEKEIMSSVTAEEPSANEETCSQTPLVEYQKVNSRYKSIAGSLTENDIFLIAACVYQESNNQCFNGQKAVAEVILNRVLASNFPNSVYSVLYSPYQFSTAFLLASTIPNETNYSAVYSALYDEPVLPSKNVVYFSRGGENNNVAAIIQDHVFCFQYSWAMEQE